MSLLHIYIYICNKPPSYCYCNKWQQREALQKDYTDFHMDIKYKAKYVLKFNNKHTRGIDSCEFRIIIHSPKRGLKAFSISPENPGTLFCWTFSILMAVSSCFFGFTQRTRDNWSNPSKYETDFHFIPRHSSSVTTRFSR